MGHVTAGIAVSVQADVEGGVAVGSAQLRVPESHRFEGVHAVPETQAVHVPARQAPPLTVVQAWPSATGTPVSTQAGGVVASPQLSVPT